MAKHIDLANSPHMAKRQQNINGKFVSTDQKWACLCVHMWGGLGSWAWNGREFAEQLVLWALLCTAWDHKRIIMVANSKQEVSVESPEMEWFVKASSSRHFSVLTVPDLIVSVITTKAQKKPLFFKMQTKATLGYMHNNVWIS